MAETKGVSSEFIDFLKTLNSAATLFRARGTPVSGEPIIMVKGSAAEAKLIESLLISAVGKQTLIATKANRLTKAAHGRKVVECETKRESGLMRLCTLQGQLISVAAAAPPTPPPQRSLTSLYGNMTNSWIQMFDNEASFLRVRKGISDDCVLLIDAYDV